MSEHEQQPQPEERVEDLDVPESESDEVKGGLLLPAVQRSHKFSKIELGGIKNELDSKFAGPGGGQQIR